MLKAPKKNHEKLCYKVLLCEVSLVRLWKKYFLPGWTFKAGLCFFSYVFSTSLPTFTLCLRIHRRLLVILKASQVCNAYAIKEFITNPINVSLGQNKRTKSALYLLSRCSWAEAQGFVSQTMCGIFYFCFHFVFTRFYFFFQQKARTLWLSNVTIPSKIKIIKKIQALFGTYVSVF